MPAHYLEMSELQPLSAKTKFAQPIIKTSPNRINSGFILALNIPQLNKTIQSKANFGFVDESAMRVLAGVVS